MICLLLQLSNKSHPPSSPSCSNPSKAPPPAASPNPSNPSSTPCSPSSPALVVFVDSSSSLVACVLFLFWFHLWLLCFVSLSLVYTWNFVLSCIFVLMLEWHRPSICSWSEKPHLSLPLLKTQSAHIVQLSFTTWIFVPKTLKNVIVECN